jgi:hypothetical protein
MDERAIEHAIPLGTTAYFIGFSSFFDQNTALVRYSR